MKWILIAICNAFFIWMLWRFSKKIAIGFICLSIIVGAISYRYQKKIRRGLFPVAKKIHKKMSIPSCAVTINSMNLRKDSYHLHRKAGKNLPTMKLVNSNTERDGLVKNGTLVSISNLDGYIVQKMNYGSPYVHKEMHDLLIDMQKRFAKKQTASNISDVQIVISSSYRTTADQKRLMRINPSATKGISSHSYGASVDIPRLKGKSCKQAKRLFEETLKELQKEKKLYLCPESKTIHITVR